MIKYPAATSGAFSEGLLSRKVHLFCRLFAVSTKIKFHFKIIVELNIGIEKPPHLATKALQRTDFSLGNQGLHLRYFKLPPCKNLPQRKITFLALELLVGLMHHTTTFRAG